MRMWFSVYTCCAIRRLLVSTMSHTSISDVPLLLRRRALGFRVLMLGFQKSLFNVYKHAVGEFFLTFSSCQLSSALLKERRKKTQINPSFVTHTLSHIPALCKAQQWRLTFCNWQTQSAARKVENKTFPSSPLAVGSLAPIWDDQIQLGGARAGRVCRAEWQLEETSRPDGSNPGPPYQCRPLGGCVWILILWGLLLGGRMPFIPPPDQTSKATRGVAVIVSFITRSFTLICGGTPDAPPLSPSLSLWLPQTHTLLFLSARGAKCCVIWV